MKFSEYMNEWLYGSNGYYRNLNIGTNGDFYTSVSVSSIFGYTIANYILDNINKDGIVAIVEIGAERGNLISDVAYYLKYNSRNFKKIDFFTIEPLIEMHIFQNNTFNSKIKDKKLTILTSFDKILTTYNQIFFVSNELFDAFPCELYHDGKIAYIENNRLSFKDAYDDISKIAQIFNIHTGEIPITNEFFTNLNSLNKWFFISFDYGLFERKNEFTIRSYKDHTTNNLFLNSTNPEYDNNFLNNFCKCDITYDVNFEIIRQNFTNINSKELLFGRQNRILVDMGLDIVCQWYMQHFGFENFQKETSKIRTIIDPALLGERFFGFCYQK